MNIPSRLENEVSEFTEFLSKYSQNGASIPYEVLEARIDAIKLFVQQLETTSFSQHKALTEVQNWFRAQTDEAFLSSRMVRRARTWPEGYPGDYVTLEAIYENEPTGKGLAKHLDRYFLSRTLAVAVRSRLRKLTELLKKRVLEEGRDGNWLNIACGSCRELLDVEAPNRTIHCIDSDVNALKYAEHIQADQQALSMNFVAENALRFVNTTRTLDNYGSLTTIYSAGLFDYIESVKLVKLLRGLYKALSEGGVIIAPFKDRSRYETFDYHWLSKWDFFHQRTIEEFLEVFHAVGVPDSMITMERDETGVIPFFIIRK